MQFHAVTQPYMIAWYTNLDDSEARIPHRLSLRKDRLPGRAVNDLKVQENILPEQVVSKICGDRGNYRDIDLRAYTIRYARAAQ